MSFKAWMTFFLTRNTKEKLFKNVHAAFLLSLVTICFLLSSTEKNVGFGFIKFILWVNYCAFNNILLATIGLLILSIHLWNKSWAHKSRHGSIKCYLKMQSKYSEPTNMAPHREETNQYLLQAKFASWQELPRNDWSTSHAPFFDIAAYNAIWMLLM